MNVKEIFATSEALERDGIWIDYGTFKVKVAYAGGANRRYNKRMEELTRPHRRAILNDAFPKESQVDLLKQAVAETVILGWEGVEDNGVPVPFSPAAALDLFRKYEKFFEDILQQAQSFANFREEDRAAASGN